MWTFLTDNLANLKFGWLLGIVYGIGTLGLSLSYRFLKFPDFSLIASITLGGVACLSAISTFGTFWVGIPAGIFAGGVVGLITSFQVNVCRILPLLAGIITFTCYQTFAFMLMSGQSVISVTGSLRDSYDWFMTPSFSTQNLIVLIIISTSLCWILSSLFRVKLGSLIWAMTGTEHYRSFRHIASKTTTAIVLVLSNGIVGLAGSLAAILHTTAHETAHEDFLIIALSAYSFAHTFITMLQRPTIRKYLLLENQLSSEPRFKLLILAKRLLMMNDEHPLKMFTVFVLYVLCAVLINTIFTIVDIYSINDANNIKHIVKGLILFLILVWAKAVDSLAKA